MVDTFTPSEPSAVDVSKAADALSQRRLLRRDLRATRATLSGVDRDRATRTLNDRLVTHLLDERELHGMRGGGIDIVSLAGYLAVGGELDIASAMMSCRQRDITTLLPVLDGNSLVFSSYGDGTVMVPNRFGIDEPVRNGSPVVQPMDVDVVLVPLVGFDKRCERMGMGGGFYDRSFAARRQSGPTPWLIGVAFDCQGVADVFPDWWDVPLDAVVTESTVHRRPA